MPRICLHLFAWLIVSLSLAGNPSWAQPRTATDEVRLNQVQVIGTHNSYHVAQPKSVLDEIAKRSQQLADSLDYTHRPLPEQFGRLGVRQIELDLFADPVGGLYAKPAMLGTVPDAVPIENPTAMQQPGLKVLHVQDIDYRTTTPTLVIALQQIRDWLRENPDSYPITVMLELKQSSIGPEFTQPKSFTAEQLDSIDREILSVFKPEEIIKPDDVRGEKKTLREAVLAGGWPTLAECRGKVLFAMDNGGELRDAYLKDHPALQDRLLFVSVDASHPAAAFMKLNDPFGQFEEIQSAVRSGFIVRTRADSGTKESRLNDTKKREQAFASGAQFVSTDYPEPDKRFSDFQVRFPDGIVARANPVSGTELPNTEYDGVGRKVSWSPPIQQPLQDKALTRIAFGSCAKQDRPQPIWDSVIASNPDLFLFIGDNIYGDSKEIDVLRKKYGQLGAQPGFRRLAETCPIAATWDDHDYGANDAGVEFPIKRASQQLFLDFFKVPADDPRRTREGVYASSIIGPAGKRVQIILLDTRYFRSPLASKKNNRPRAEGLRGSYVPTKDRSATMLGDEQWKWLEAELRKPADVRIIASSIQVLSYEHGFEKWYNFPRERTRLLTLIRDTNAKGVVFLSGDRHLAEISRLNVGSAWGIDYPIYDITSSSLNSPSGNHTKSGTRFVNEVNFHRVGLTYFETNFGTIEIDWPKKAKSDNAIQVRLQVRDEAGGVVLQQSVEFPKQH